MTAMTAVLFIGGPAHGKTAYYNGNPPRVVEVPEARASLPYWVHPFLEEEITYALVTYRLTQVWTAGCPSYRFVCDQADRGVELPNQQWVPDMPCGLCGHEYWQVPSYRCAACDRPSSQREQAA